MRHKAFNVIKKEIVYPTVNKVRKEVVHASIKCTVDTVSSIHFELGEHDANLHRRTNVPSFQLDYMGERIKLTVNENVRMFVHTQRVTSKWLKAELCQWLSYELCKQRAMRDIPMQYPYY